MESQKTTIGDAETAGSVVAVGAIGGGPTAEEFRAAQWEAFSDPSEWVGDCAIRMFEVTGTDLPCFRPAGAGGASCLVVPPQLVGAVLRFVHGSRANGHYGLRQTEARVRGQYLWPSWRRDIRMKIARCVPCTAETAARPVQGASMEVYHPCRRFQQVAVDVLTITQRTLAGNINVLVMIDTFTRFARAVPIPDERAETVARKILDEWVAIFGAMETFLSDRGPNFIGKVVSNMAERLGTKPVTTSPFHPQANGCVERWNRTLPQDIACFVCTRQDYWDLHVSLACLMYNTGIHEAAQVSPFEAMFGIEAFAVWGKVEADRVMREPYCTTGILRELHSRLPAQGMKAHRNAAAQ